MRIAPQYLARYPAFVDSVARQVLFLPSRDLQVFEMFRRYAGIASRNFELQSRLIFTPAEEPIIHIEKIALDYRMADWSDVWATRPADIVVDVDLVNYLEGHPGDVNTHHMVRSVVLQETIHWARFNFSLRYPNVTPEPSGQDYGCLFEQAAYGRLTPRPLSTVC